MVHFNGVIWVIYNIYNINIPKFYKIIYNDEKNFKKCFTFDNIEYMNVEQDRLEDHEIECSKLKI